MRTTRRNKYGNNWTRAEDGTLFQSKAEMRRYNELTMLQGAGVISGLKCQPHFVLQPRYDRNGKTVRAITYKADFSYVEDGQHVVEDVKGVQTQAFRIKWKMAQYQNPGIEFRIVEA